MSRTGTTSDPRERRERREPANPDVEGTARDEAGGESPATGGVETADVGRRAERTSEESI